jgi:hypothetical protein
MIASNLKDMIRRDKNVCFELTLLTYYNEEITRKEKLRRYGTLPQDQVHRAFQYRLQQLVRPVNVDPSIFLTAFPTRSGLNGATDFNRRDPLWQIYPRSILNNAVSGRGLGSKRQRRHGGISCKKRSMLTRTSKISSEI